MKTTARRFSNGDVTRVLLVALVVVCGCSRPKSEAVAKAAASEKPFTASLVRASPTSATVTFAAGPGLHINEEYPARFIWSDTSTVAHSGASVPLLESLVRTPCAEHKAEACRATAPIEFTGEGTVAGTLALSVCNKDQCLIEKVALTMSEVEAPRASQSP